MDARDGDDLVVTRLAGEVRGRVRRDWCSVYGDHVSDCAGRIEHALYYMAGEGSGDANSDKKRTLASFTVNSGARDTRSTSFLVPEPVTYFAPTALLSATSSSLML